MNKSYHKQGGLPLQASKRQAPLPKKSETSPPQSPEVLKEDLFSMSAHDVRQRIGRKKSDKRLQRHTMGDKVGLFNQL